MGQRSTKLFKMSKYRVQSFFSILNLENMMQNIEFKDQSISQRYQSYAHGMILELI